MYTYAYKGVCIHMQTPSPAQGLTWCIENQVHTVYRVTLHSKVQYGASTCEDQSSVDTVNRLAVLLTHRKQTLNHSQVAEPMLLCYS